MTVSPADPALHAFPWKHRVYDLAISLGSCALFMLLVGIQGGLMWFAILVVHELGHFAMGYRFTGRAPAIIIYPGLGVTFSPGMSRRSTIENLAFALGGIWMSIAVALVLLAVARRSDLAFAYLGMSLGVNAINALPIPRIDGGRVCQLIFRTLPAPWPRVLGISMFGLGIAVAVWMKDPFFWAVMALIAFLSLMMWARRVRFDFPALAPREAVAWFAAYVLTLSLVCHLLWVVLSEPNATFRIMRGLGLASA